MRPYPPKKILGFRLENEKHRPHGERNPVDLQEIAMVYVAVLRKEHRSTP